MIRIIDFLIDNPLSDYSKEEMIKGIGISKVTFYKYFPLLEESGMDMDVKNRHNFNFDLIVKEWEEYVEEHYHNVTHLQEIPEIIYANIGYAPIWQKFFIYYIE